jgi:hypothetical protein
MDEGLDKIESLDSVAMHSSPCVMDISRTVLALVRSPAYFLAFDPGVP